MLPAPFPNERAGKPCTLSRSSTGKPLWLSAFQQHPSALWRTCGCELSKIWPLAVRARLMLCRQWIVNDHPCMKQPVSRSSRDSRRPVLVETIAKWIRCWLSSGDENTVDDCCWNLGFNILPRTNRQGKAPRKFVSIKSSCSSATLSPSRFTPIFVRTM